MSATFDADAYLSRIGLAERPEPNLQGLTTLQRAHMLAVPFENLDVVTGAGIDLDLERLFDKIVTRRRGGYCFELNGLYGSLLDGLGFERRPVSARVWYRRPEGVPPLTHALNIVRLAEGEVMSDVGFGGNAPRIPLPLGEDATAEDEDGPLRLRFDPEFGYRLARRTPEGWIEQFSTDARRAYPSDMVLGSHYASRHPDSFFTQAVVAGRFTPEGRISLVDKTLSERRGYEIETEELESGAAVVNVLSDRFGIALAPDQTEAITARLYAKCGN